CQLAISERRPSPHVSRPQWLTVLVTNGNAGHPAFPHRRCGLAESALERARKSTSIFEAARVRDFRDAELRFVDEPQCSFQALLDQHRVRRLAVYGIEGAYQMARRIVRHPRELGDGEIEIAARLHVVANALKAQEYAAPLAERATRTPPDQRIERGLKIE